MITTLVAIAVFIAYGLQQAQQDKGGKPNDQHAPDWQERAAFALFVAGVLTLMHQFYLVAYHDAAIEFGAMGWRFIGLCLIGYGAFTPVFRWRLNKLRGMDARYVSPSSAYDTQFILFSIAVGQLDIPRRDRFTLKEMHRIMQDHDTLMHASEVHWIDMPDGPDLNMLPAWYVKQVHRAGTWAYAFEGAAFWTGCAINLELWK